MPLRYSQEVRPEDTVRAMETITPGLFPDSAEPLAVDFAGNCPRCGDVLPPMRRWLVVVAPAAKINDRQRKQLAAELRDLGIDLSRGDESFELTCWCEDTHPDRPKDKKGCGAPFRVRVMWSP